MIRVVFDDDLIKYIYQECSQAEEKSVEESVKESTKMCDELLEYINVKEFLRHAYQSPSPRLMEKILAYARRKKKDEK